MTNVNGKLDLVHLHCRGGKAEHSYAPDIIRTVPAGWGSCNACAGTTLRIARPPW